MKTVITDRISDMTRPALAKLVRARREHLGYTQEELARRVGVSRSAIAEIEAGRVANPRVGAFSRLAKVLGLPTVALLAAVGYIVGDAMDGSLQLPDLPMELFLIGTVLSQASLKDRRWLRDRLAELYHLMSERRSSPRSESVSRSRAATRRPAQAKRRRSALGSRKK
jgi:transcriptional regulator with XRE-family HTH domain